MKKEKHLMALICVTGASGRIGSKLVSHLKRAGHDVRCVVRTRDRLSLGGVDVVEAPLTDGAALARAVSGADVVVHLAAQMVLDQTPVERYYDINVMGTLRLLEAVAAQSVRQFVYASTDNTYDPANAPSEPITEDHPQYPGDYYGTSKVLCEQLVRNYHKLHGLDYTILRYGSVLAPQEAAALFRLDWVRGFLTTHAAAGRRSNLWQLLAGGHDFPAALEEQVGDRDDNPALALIGADGRPWALHTTDVRDAVAGTVAAIDHPNALNQAFNIVGPHTTTFTEGATVIAKHYNLDLITARMPATLAFELATGKAARLLGYHPRHDFDSTITTALDPADQGWISTRDAEED
ncbi:NAD-dependent epimerase/dehydratase family protein [Amycolatopsis pithecellobii]|uniref:NAD-dependent epimerase/dehydratase family protein n=1 Tax=Amycolatopsis pithecellobii TaxID=664692 RepID=A0A6N7ZBE9_9PSEU|nr:NAD(P)-dependent oxidoreductase [Amycolatopsis pithecellobii]MTD59005.1 NAD-dependent epimerase/dehydratase family protein [Amycolatopsis pithecellobii]